MEEMRTISNQLEANGYEAKVRQIGVKHEKEETIKDFGLVREQKCNNRYRDIHFLEYAINNKIRNMFEGST